MTNQGVIGTFGSHAFLAGLSERNLMRLASGARPFTRQPMEFLARKGEPANAFYLIQSGRVEIGHHDDSGQFVPITEAGPGEIVGWSWIVEPHRWQFDCRTAEPVQGVSFNAAWLREQCEVDHELGYHLLQHLLAVVASRLASLRRSVQPSATTRPSESFAEFVDNS